jgi:circadian clock protein KaiC
MGQTPYKLVETQRGLISRVGPKRIVLDGIKSLRRIYGEKYYHLLIRCLANLYKEMKVTSIMTAIGNIFEEGEIATLADNLICLDLRKEGNQFVREIGVVKARGSKISDELKTIYFSDGGKLYVDQ